MGFEAICGSFIFRLLEPAILCHFGLATLVHTISWKVPDFLCYYCKTQHLEKPAAICKYFVVERRKNL